MIVVVPSIPHTGTQFVFYELLGFLEPEIRNPKRSNHGKIWLHTYPERIPELKTLIDYPWIVPLRHPIKVGESWKGRQKDLHYLKRLFDLLMEEIHPSGPLYMPIDAERRQVFLDKINERLKTDIRTQWQNRTATGHTGTLTSEEIALLGPAVEFYESISSA